MKDVKDASERRRLLLDTKKTKVMVIDSNQDDDGETFETDGRNLEKVTRFEYLGSMSNTIGDCSEETKRRLSMGRNGYRYVEDMERRLKGLSTAFKVRLLRATAFAVATYGAESWTMKKNERKRVDAFEIWCYRRLLSAMDGTEDKRIGSGEDWQRHDSKIEHSETNKPRYFGHIIRHTSLEQDVMQGQAEGIRGRSPTSWMDDMRTLTDGTAAQATRLACNRHVWRTLVSATPSRVRAL